VQKKQDELKAAREELAVKIGENGLCFFFFFSFFRTSQTENSGESDRFASFYV